MTSPLSASAQRAVERRANHKLAVLRHVEEVSGNIAASCRYYGVSRQAYYAWLKRYEAEGFEGLKDRSSAPHHSPTATDAQVVEKILWRYKRRETRWKRYEKQRPGHALQVDVKFIEPLGQTGKKKRCY